jgi:hypothetical protein
MSSCLSERIYYALHRFSGWNNLNILLKTMPLGLPALDENVNFEIFYIQWGIRSVECTCFLLHSLFLYYYGILM